MIARRLLAEEEMQNEWIWSVHLKASCLVDLGRSNEALAILEEASEAAAALEVSCEDFLIMLETCAEFHETFSKVYAGLGRSDEAQRSTDKAGEIRARIEELKAGDEP